MQEIRSTSVENLRLKVTAPAGINPTTDVVAVALTPGGATPTAPDWRVASWEPVVNGVYVAKCLVGTGATGALTPGVYSAFVRVSDSPETPVVLAGYIRSV